MSRTVEVRVAGQNYRVVSSAPESEVRRLADVVNAKLAELVPRGRAAPPNALLLAAIALAHDAEEERERRESVEARARELLRRVVAGIGEALGEPAAGAEREAAPEDSAVEEGQDGAVADRPRRAAPGKGSAEAGHGAREVSRET